MFTKPNKIVFVRAICRANLQVVLSFCVDVTFCQYFALLLLSQSVIYDFLPCLEFSLPKLHVQFFFWMKQKSTTTMQYMSLEIKLTWFSICVCFRTMSWSKLKLIINFYTYQNSIMQKKSAYKEWIKQQIDSK